LLLVFPVLKKPTGNPSEPFWACPVNFGEDARAFVNDELTGIGFTGVWNAGTGVRETEGETVQDRAEVWFDRCDAVV
jgi:hypothetical protein